MKKSGQRNFLYLFLRKPLNIQTIEDARLVINSVIQQSFDENTKSDDKYTFYCKDGDNKDKDNKDKDNKVGDVLRFSSTSGGSANKIGEIRIQDEDGSLRIPEFHIWKIEKDTQDGKFKFKEEPFKSSSSES